MCTGRGLPVANAENAAATASAASSGEDTRRLHATIRSSAPVASLVSCSLPRSEPVPVGAPGESSKTGRDSAQDVAAAAAALSRPGPDVVTTTPGRPDTHAAASAAYPAPCSCARGHRPDPGRGEPAVQLQVVRARDAEHGLDAVRGQGLDHRGASVAGHDRTASTDSSS